jgi:hypothetical protein
VPGMTIPSFEMTMGAKRQFPGFQPKRNAPQKNKG